jgi:predicted alpha/beta superfamily hydrolase
MQTFHKIFLAALPVILHSCTSIAKNTGLPAKKVTMHSMFVKDSFEIYTTLPKDYAGPGKSFPVIFYMDANLKSGNKLREIIDERNKQGKPINAVFVGVGHIGNYHSLRRRDFITPFIKDEHDSLFSNDKSYGQCQNFYLFLKEELIPYIEKNYKVNSNRTLIGHSLGGLFAFYCLFKNERPFTSFVALSPALWINHANIYAFENKYRHDSSSLQANLYLCIGGAERFNYILPGSKKMRDYLENNPYAGLHFEYHEFAGETHNSEVPLALKLILPALKLD